MDYCCRNLHSPKNHPSLGNNYKPITVHTAFWLNWKLTAICRGNDQFSISPAPTTIQNGEQTLTSNAIIVHVAATTCTICKWLGRGKQSGPGGHFSYNSLAMKTVNKMGISAITLVKGSSLLAGCAWEGVKGKQHISWSHAVLTLHPNFKLLPKSHQKYQTTKLQRLGLFLNAKCV